MHSDPIADMLTRIRNAGKNGHSEVKVKASKICRGVADVLKSEGYINDVEKIDDATKQGFLRITLKYAPDGTPAINEIKRVSKTGRRIYSAAGKLPYVMNGMGILIVTTNKGVMTDKQCREAKLGGEIICMVN